MPHKGSPKAILTRRISIILARALTQVSYCRVLKCPTRKVILGKKISQIRRNSTKVRNQKYVYTSSALRGRTRATPDTPIYVGESSRPHPYFKSTCGLPIRDLIKKPINREAGGRLKMLGRCGGCGRGLGGLCIYSAFPSVFWGKCDKHESEAIGQL